jgi:hypothetical protein
MKYYAINAKFKYIEYYHCSFCKAGLAPNDCRDFLLDSDYESDSVKYCEIETIYKPIDNIKGFIDKYKDHINPDMTFNKSFPEYEELKKKAIGEYIDNIDDCSNMRCKNGDIMFGGYGNAKSDYDSECITMELIEDKKRYFIENLQ